MQPRFASSVVSIEPFAQQVFRCTVEEWRRLPPQGRGFVLPEDVKTLAPDVLRHRLVTTYEAEAQSVTGEQIIARLLEGIGIP